MAEGTRKQQFEGSTRTRLALAAIACGPLAGLALLTTIGLAGALISAASGGSAGFPPQAILGGAVIGAAIGWPLMLVYGLPAHHLLYRRGSRKVGGYLLSGVIAGFGVSVVIFLLMLPTGMFQYAGQYAGAAGVITLLCMFGSVLASWFFWLIRRPDKDVLRPAALAAAFE